MVQDPGSRIEGPGSKVQGPGFKFFFKEIPLEGFSYGGYWTPEIPQFTYWKPVGANVRTTLWRNVQAAKSGNFHINSKDFVLHSDSNMKGPFF